MKDTNFSLLFVDLKSTVQKPFHCNFGLFDAIFQSQLQNEKYTSYDLTFAPIREEVDSISNKSKENRVVINGLKSATPLPTETRTRENQEKSSNQEKACHN